MDFNELPQNKDLTYLGLSTYRDQNKLFGIKRRDRRQHVYILGKSGTGKSALMSNMMVQNIMNGDGVCVVDPHGELVEGILKSIPEHRMKDVVYFNPADPDFHMGFNVLELVDPKYKHLVASGLMGIFTKIWANVWSARMEYILNNAILALLDTPGTTMLGIPRILVDKDYRQQIIDNLKDPVIKAFWVHEYESWQERFRNEAIAPIQNKVGQFLSSSIVRNVVGQSKSTINLFDIMNEKKIFLVNVSKGRIGEDNSALLGGMIITKLQLAAMERVRIPEDQREDFYLYVDEFQNFVTDAFASILSEARKYRLNLTVAHQYSAQLVTKESSAVRDAVFGNVGTMIIFRVGADDADFLEKEFSPEFTEEDLVNLPNYRIYLKLMIDGITSRPFSAKTIPPLITDGNAEIEQKVIDTSRELYCRPRVAIEREINEWSGMTTGLDTKKDEFQVKCSLCAKDTTVPFKPDKDRPVYCKDCLNKIKEGKAKPLPGFKVEQIDDEQEYYRPLSALGIEFADDGKGSFKSKRGRSRSRDNRKKSYSSNKRSSRSNKSREKVNTGLKSLLDKALSSTEGEVKEEKKEVPPAISLGDLKSSETKPVSKMQNKNDRSAGEDKMNALKDLISDKVAPMMKEEGNAPEKPNPEIKSEPEANNRTDIPKPPTNEKPEPKATPNEVPEGVLRKVLE